MSIAKAQSSTNRKIAQGEASRQRLIASARGLFESQGFAATSTEQLLAQTDLTRGALYHHFRDKKALFGAVLEQVHGELLETIHAATKGLDDPVLALRKGAHAWLQAAADPRTARLLVVEAPAVLGPQAWNAVDDARGFAALQAGVAAVLAAKGATPAQIQAAAVALNGAMNELARWLAHEPARLQQQLPLALAALDQAMNGFVTAA